MNKNITKTLEKVKVGYAITGSFCTFSKAIKQMEALAAIGCEIIPIMSFNAFTLDTKFGKASEHISKIERICGRKIISTIEDAEPIGPKHMTDIMIVAPCTGNTLAKLARSITDTPVTMAVKSHLRQLYPVLIAPSTNDALAGSFKNIGALMNMRNYYFVPFRQDDFLNKPNSLVADFDRLVDATRAALDGRQLQPVIG